MAACHEFPPGCRSSTQTGRVQSERGRASLAVLYSSAAGRQGGAGGNGASGPDLSGMPDRRVRPAG